MTALGAPNLTQLPVELLRISSCYLNYSHLFTLSKCTVNFQQVFSPIIYRTIVLVADCHSTTISCDFQCPITSFETFFSAKKYGPVFRMNVAQVMIPWTRDNIPDILHIHRNIDIVLGLYPKLKKIVVFGDESWKILTSHGFHATSGYYPFNTLLDWESGKVTKSIIEYPNHEAYMYASNLYLNISVFGSFDEGAWFENLTTVTLDPPEPCSLELHTSVYKSLKKIPTLKKLVTAHDCKSLQSLIHIPLTLDYCELHVYLDRPSIDSNPTSLRPISVSQVTTLIAYRREHVDHPISLFQKVQFSNLKYVNFLTVNDIFVGRDNFLLNSTDLSHIRFLCLSINRPVDLLRFIKSLPNYPNLRQLDLFNCDTLQLQHAQSLNIDGLFMEIENFMENHKLNIFSAKIYDFNYFQSNTVSDARVVKYITSLVVEPMKMVDSLYQKLTEGESYYDLVNISKMDMEIMLYYKITFEALCFQLTKLQQLKTVRLKRCLQLDLSSIWLYRLSVILQQFKKFAFVFDTQELHESFVLSKFPNMNPKVSCYVHIVEHMDSWHSMTVNKLCSVSNHIVLNSEALRMGYAEELCKNRLVYDYGAWRTITPDGIENGGPRHFYLGTMNSEFNQLDGVRSERNRHLEVQFRE